MISSKNQYLFVGGLGDLDINGKVMPLREDDAKNLIRGEDIAFLDEAANERYYLREGSEPPSVGKEVPFDIKTFSPIKKRGQLEMAGNECKWLGGTPSRHAIPMNPDIDIIPEMMFDGQSVPIYKDQYSNFSPTFDDGLVGWCLKADDVARVFENIKQSRRILLESGILNHHSRVSFYNDQEYWTYTYNHMWNDYDGTRRVEPRRANYPLTSGYHSREVGKFTRYSESLPTTYDIDTYGGSSYPPSSFNYYEFAALANVPCGAKVTPVFKVYCSLEYQRHDAQNNASGFIYRSGYVNGTTFTAPSSKLNTVTFLYDDSVRRAISRAVDRFSDYTLERVGRYYIDMPMRDFMPAWGNMYVTHDSMGLSMREFDYKWIVDITCDPYGFILELGDHTKWWTD